MKSKHWHLVACAATHQSSTVQEREPIQIRPEELAPAGALFGGLDGVYESAVVATCNRVEFYFVTSRETDPLVVVSEFYDRFRGLDLGPHRPLFRVETGPPAAEHLFRVAAGVESVVVGENQILGQLKSAYSAACAVKSAGKVIHRLFHQAFRVGKQVRSDTGIGKGACSVSTAAVEMISEAVRALDQPAIVFVGVNQMIRLAARRLAQLKGARFTFANRTASKAHRLALGFAPVPARGTGLDDLPELLEAADVAITCTSSPVPVVTRDMMERVAGRGNGRGLLIVDLAVPRDVEPAPPSRVEGPPAVSVYDLEDLKRFVASRQREREREIPRVDEIVERRLGEFAYWYGHVLHEPHYNGSERAMEALRVEALAPIIERLSPELRDQLNDATRQLVERVAMASKKAPGGSTK